MGRIDSKIQLSR